MCNHGGGSGTQFGALAEALGTLARPNADNDVPQIGIVKIDGVVDRACAALQPVVAAKQIRLLVRGGNYQGQCDSLILEAVVKILLDTAIAHTDAGGFIHVYCARQVDQIHFVVRSGRRTARTGRKYLHDELYRLTDAVQAEAGSRQGFAAALGHIEKAGMNLKMNAMFGLGTRFILSMAAVATVAVPADESAPTFMEGMDVIVLEDNVALSQCVCALVQTWGGEVREMHSVLELMQACSQAPRPPDLLIVDYWLDGDQSGLDATRWLRQMFRNESIPVALVTGDLDLRLSLTATDRNIVLIDKPFSTAQLRDAVQSLLAGDGACAYRACALQ
jgi:two-component system, sensor histidine kinase